MAIATTVECANNNRHLYDCVSIRLCAARHVVFVQLKAKTPLSAPKMNPQFMNLHVIIIHCYARSVPFCRALLYVAV